MKPEYIHLLKTIPLLALLTFFFTQETSAQGGYAIAFDGINDRLVTTHDAGFSLTTNGSWEAWVYLEDNTNNQIIFTKTTAQAGSPGYLYTGYFISLENQRLTFSQGTAAGALQQTTSSLDPIPNTTWTHVSIVKNGAVVTMYVNGIDVTQTGAAHSDIVTNTADLLMGSWDTDTDPLAGYLDEVRIWQDVRTAAEIRTYMCRELLGTEGDLLLYYAMSAGSGTSLADHSSNAYAATLTQGPTWRYSGALAGPMHGLDLDGTDDYVVLTDIDLSGDFTLAGWINLGTAANERPILSKQTVAGASTDAQAEFALQVEASDNLHFFMSSPETDHDVSIDAGLLTEGRWYHVAVVMATNTATLYLNGVPVGSDTYEGTRRDGPIPLNLGRYWNNDTTYWLGQLDEVRIWNDARTEDEICRWMYQPLTGEPAGLAAHYRLDLGASAGLTAAYDLSGNGLHGTLMQMDPATDRISSTAYHTWQGGTDSDWADPSNWSQGSVPAADEQVGLYAWGGASAPLLDSDRALGQLYVDAATTLDLNGHTLTLSQHLFNEGTLSGGGGMTFSGSQAQAWQGDGSARIGTLTLNNLEGLELAQAIQVDTQLVLSAGILTVESTTLTLDTAALIGGSPTHGTHVDATNGVVRKSWNRNASFLFPVGDATFHSPIALFFTSGLYTDAYVDISLRDARHPNDTSGVNYLTRYWIVNTTGINTFSCDLAAYYQLSDVAGDEAQITGAKWTGFEWLMLNTVDPVSHTFSATVTEFSDFTGRDSNVLPGDELALQALREATGIRLDWYTETRVPLSHFLVEKQNRQGEWEVQASVNPQERTEAYTWLDRQPDAGTLLYRVVAIDLAGNQRLQAAVQVHWQPKLRFSVYPNPVQTQARLTFAAPLTGTLHLYDMRGQQVLQQAFSGQEIRLDLSSLAKGMYGLWISPVGSTAAPFTPCLIQKM